MADMTSLLRSRAAYLKSHGYLDEEILMLRAAAEIERLRAAAQGSFEPEVAPGYRTGMTYADGYRRGLADVAAAAPIETYKCLAGCRGACNWPSCDCDPHANRIKRALIDDEWQPPLGT